MEYDNRNSINEITDRPTEAAFNSSPAGYTYNNANAYSTERVYMNNAYTTNSGSTVNNSYTASNSGAVNNGYAANNINAGNGFDGNADGKETAKKEKKHGSGKFAKFLGKTAIVAAAGLLFGLCAAATFTLVNYYTGSGNKELTTEESADLEAMKSEIEGDILSRLADSEIKGDKIVVENRDSNNTSSSSLTGVYDAANVAEKVMPSVVSINNSYEYTANYWGREYSTEAESTGSGIIIGDNDEEYLIATNNHVIENANTLTVVFIDGAECEAKLKGADADNDLAVIAVKKSSLETSTIKAIAIATLGDSDALTVGEPAIAIGNALGYGQSVTTGVISALNRSLELEEGKMSEGFIQTDAAINPGNSGGALLNAKGEVIGINSNKIGGSTVEGMGYAIPISRALPIINNLKDKKTKEAVAEGARGYLGISGRGVSSEMAQIYDFPEGVYIYEVYPGTGAEKANLRKGDIITKFEGSTINSMEKLQEYLASYEAGETVELTVQRLNEGGAYEEIQVSMVLVDKSLLPSE